MKRFFTALLLAYALLGSAALAVDSPPAPKAVRLYGVYWQSIHIGNIIGEVKNNSDGKIEFRVAMRSLNILKRLTRYQNDASTTARFGNAQGFIPITFEVHSTLRKKTKNVALAYDAAGNVVQETIDHPPNPKKITPITADMKKDSIDPLTAALIARDKVRQFRDGGGKNYFNLKIYDGRQLFIVNFTILPATTLSWQGRSVSVIPLRFARTALGGFGKEELERMKKQDPVIDVYLSNDSALLPLEAKGKAIIGTASASLLRECQSFTECMGEE